MELGRADHFIGGKSRPPEGEHYGPLYDPSTGLVHGEIARGTPADAVHAIENAGLMADRWAGTPGHERARVLHSLSERIRADVEGFAALIASEVGKPLRDARVEVERAAAVFQFAAEEIRQLTGVTHPLDAYPFPPGNEERFFFTVREPIGVVVAISPFNFPLNLLSHKVAPALAVGNPVVAKPASVAPFTALRLARLAQEARVPDGVFNVVLGGGREVGVPLVKHDLTRLVTFTGSTLVGKEIARTAGQGAKRVILEMGGMDPLIVFDDASLEAAVEAGVRAAFGYSGQVCTATKRMFVQESIADRYAKRLTERARALRVGPANDELTEIGPLVDRGALVRMEALVAEAVERGASVLTGGQRAHPTEGGYFYGATVLDLVPEGAHVVTEEPFGPLAPILRFASEEEALTLANRSAYGLQASVFTKDLGRAFRMARGLRVGGVHINDPTNLRWDALPFGGVKQSGLGREGLSMAMREMTEVKSISLNLAPES